VRFRYGSSVGYLLLRYGSPALGARCLFFGGTNEPIGRNWIARHHLEAPSSILGGSRRENQSVSDTAIRVGFGRLAAIYCAPDHAIDEHYNGHFVVTVGHLVAGYVSPDFKRPGLCVVEGGRWSVHGAIGSRGKAAVFLATWFRADEPDWS
jgi:hypothetical protein